MPPPRGERPDDPPSSGGRGPTPPGPPPHSWWLARGPAAAARGPWFGAPGRDRLFAEPDRQTATLAQASIIFRPVRYPIPLPGDVTTAIGIDLERHGRISQGTMDGIASSHLGLLSRICRPRRFTGPPQS